MIHRFGLFEFDAAAGVLRKQGRLVRLEPQPARALALLVSRPADLVSRDDLREHVWGSETHVDFDRGLAYCIGQVRTALGDSADNPRFVETVPRRGYRFIAPVQSVADDPAATPVVEPPVMPPARPSERLRRRGWMAGLVAVLALVAAVWTGWVRATTARPIVAVTVFDNETGIPEFDALASTAADIMVERLTALGPDAVGVVGNTPALRRSRAERSPRAIAEETGAAYLVVGQVQQDEAGVRLVAHLIRLDDNTHLWVTRVARAPSGLGDIQDVVADRLADAVRRHVIARDPDAPRFTP